MTSKRFHISNAIVGALLIFMVGLLFGCGSGGSGGSGGSSGSTGSSGPDGAGGTGGTGGTGGSGSVPTTPGTDPISFSDDWPAAGTAERLCSVPLEAQAADTTNPDRVVGNGTPESCTSAAVVAAVAGGGVVTFDCGPDPVTITLTETIKIFNDTGPEIVIDGGGLVTLDGDNQHRILYMNTCDESLVWTTDRCYDQDHPRLTVQNLTFVNGYTTGGNEEGGGGAIFVRGGLFKIVNSRFFNNRCDLEGPDVGGAAVRLFEPHNSRPVYVVGSTFGGRADLGNIGSNGGALSSIHTSFTVINSVMSYNEAVGNGANPPEPGTPGGGNGGAIYNDGTTMTLEVCGSTLTNNTANEGGGAIFFVSNDESGFMRIDRSYLSQNPSLGFETAPGIYVWPYENHEYIDSVIE